MIPRVLFLTLLLEVHGGGSGGDYRLGAAVAAQSEAPELDVEIRTMCATVPPVGCWQQA
jgi:hypothetical protein